MISTHNKRSLNYVLPALEIFDTVLESCNDFQQFDSFNPSASTYVDLSISSFKIFNFSGQLFVCSWFMFYVWFYCIHYHLGSMYAQQKVTNGLSTLRRLELFRYIRIIVLIVPNNSYGTFLKFYLLHLCQFSPSNN